jgi:hypothetical protein
LIRIHAGMIRGKFIGSAKNSKTFSSGAGIHCSNSA